MYVSKKEFILISKNVAIMCGMYIINGGHGPEPKSSGGNTSSNQQVSALIPLKSSLILFRVTITFQWDICVIIKLS